MQYHLSKGIVNWPLSSMISFARLRRMYTRLVTTHSIVRDDSVVLVHSRISMTQPSSNIFEKHIPHFSNSGTQSNINRDGKIIITEYALTVSK
jgi:hypothetical protein